VTDRRSCSLSTTLKAFEIPEVTETEKSEKYRGAVGDDVEISVSVRHLQGTSDSNISG